MYLQKLRKQRCDACGLGWSQMVEFKHHMWRTHAKQLYCFLRARSSDCENTHFLDLPSDMHLGWKSRKSSSSSHFFECRDAGSDFDEMELDNLLYNGFTSIMLDPTCMRNIPPLKKWDTRQAKISCKRMRSDVTLLKRAPTSHLSAMRSQVFRKECALQRLRCLIASFAHIILHS